MKLECRSFNDEGIDAAAAILDELRAAPDEEVPVSLLSDPALSEIVGGQLALPREQFASRWHFGIWLYREVNKSVSDASVLQQPGYWTWLALYLFGIVRPPGTKVYENARYILNRDDFRKRYRHLVAGPYYVFLAHESEPHVIRGLLATPPYAPGDLYEQFASRQELITSSAVMQLITKMYLDEANGTLRRGAGGNARRLAEVLMQYDVTYDFATIPVERLAAMLPREFRRFTRAA